MLGRPLGTAPLGTLPDELFDRAEHSLAVALSKYRANDDGWKVYVRELASTVAKLERAAGRPPLPKGQTKAEQHAAYADQHGFAAAAKHFSVKEATIERDWRRINGKPRGQ